MPRMTSTDLAKLRIAMAGNPPKRYARKPRLVVERPAGTLTAAVCRIPGHPPSINDKARDWRKNHAVVTAYHEKAALCWLQATGGERIVKADFYELQIVYHGPRTCDFDNMGKAAQDAAARALGFNDFYALPRPVPGDPKEPQCHVVTVRGISASDASAGGR